MKEKEDRRKNIIIKEVRMERKEERKE